MAVNNISAEIGKSWINCGFLDTSVGKANYLFQLLCLLWLKSGLDEVNETVSVSTQVCVDFTLVWISYLGSRLNLHILVYNYA